MEWRVGPNTGRIKNNEDTLYKEQMTKERGSKGSSGKAHKEKGKELGKPIRNEFLVEKEKMKGSSDVLISFWSSKFNVKSSRNLGQRKRGIRGKVLEDFLTSEFIHLEEKSILFSGKGPTRKTHYQLSRPWNLRNIPFKSLGNEFYLIDLKCESDLPKKMSSMKGKTNWIAKKVISFVSYGHNRKIWYG